MHQAELLEKMTHLSESIEESLMKDYKLWVGLRETNWVSAIPHLIWACKDRDEFLELGIGCYSCKRDAQ